MAYLRCIANPWDESALRRIINFPARGIGDATIQKIANAAQEESVPFFRFLKDPQRVPGLKGPFSIGFDNLTHFSKNFVTGFLKQTRNLASSDAS